MKMFTLDDVKDMAKVVAYENPEKINPGLTFEDGIQSGGCYYTWEDGSHCIAGEVLTRLGVDVPEWEEEINTSTVSFLPQQYIGEFEPDAVRFLQIAQSVADKGAPWAEAYDVAVDIPPGSES
jgi:hypothetical protein